jgi:glycosyltransferase involved in cell wall biosynthesis
MSTPPDATRKTALVIAGEFPPVKTIGRLRTVKFVEHLRAHGWDSVVLTIEPNGISSVADPALEGEIPPGTPVYRAAHPDIEALLVARIKRLAGRGPAAVPADRTGGGSSADAAAAPAAPSAPASPTLRDRAIGAFKAGLRDYVYLPDSYAFWARPAVRLGRQAIAEHGADLIYTTLPPFTAAIIGRRLQRATGLPWVADYRDLWTGDVLREWVGPMRRRYETWLERRLLRHADAVITVSEQKTEYVRRLLQPCDALFDTITNGYDEEEFAGIARTPRPDDGTLRFVFTGRLFKNRRGYAFAEALARIKRSRPDLAARARVSFLGGVTPEIRERYDRILGGAGLTDQFHFPGDVPHREAKQAQVDTDWLLLIVDTGATSDGVIPGKLFEYVAARRPIFALTDPGATATIIKEGELGEVVDAEDVDACERALTAVLERPVPPELAPTESFLQRFERRRLTERLAGIFDKVVEKRRA